MMNMTNRISERRLTRFWSFATKAGRDECWLWRGPVNKKGYGVFYAGGTIKSAHRAAWTFLVGTIPDGLFVLHRCDVPGCVNPHHLFLGTHQDNMDDMRQKGRYHFQQKSGDSMAACRVTPYDKMNYTHGSRHPDAKLDEGKVASILARLCAGEEQTNIAKDYGVARSTIGRLLEGKTWKHVPRKAAA